MPRNRDTLWFGPNGSFGRCHSFPQVAQEFVRERPEQEKRLRKHRRGWHSLLTDDGVIHLVRTKRHSPGNKADWVAVRGEKVASRVCNGGDLSDVEILKAHHTLDGLRALIEN